MHVHGVTRITLEHLSGRASMKRRRREKRERLSLFSDGRFFLQFISYSTSSLAKRPCLHSTILQFLLHSTKVHHVATPNYGRSDRSATPIRVMTTLIQRSEPDVLKQDPIHRLRASLGWLQLVLEEVSWTGLWSELGYFL